MSKHSRWTVLKIYINSNSFILWAVNKNLECVSKNKIPHFVLSRPKANISNFKEMKVHNNKKKKVAFLFWSFWEWRWEVLTLKISICSVSLKVEKINFKSNLIMENQYILILLTNGQSCISFELVTRYQIFEVLSEEVYAVKCLK